MSATFRRTDEVPPPPPTQPFLRRKTANAAEKETDIEGEWPPRDRVVALGELLTTKREAGQVFPSAPRVPRLEWPIAPHPWLSRAARVWARFYESPAATGLFVASAFATGAWLGARLFAPRHVPQNALRILRRLAF